MENANILSIVNFIISITSICLAFVAMFQAGSSAKESRKNYERTKDVLAEINTRASVIEATVQKSQDQLMNTMTKIIDETVIPKKTDPKTDMFYKLMAENPQMQQLAINKFSETMKNSK